MNSPNQDATGSKVTPRTEGSAADTAGMVQRLYDPRTRRTARLELMRAGAVGPLMECLRARNESVVWAAVVSLGQLEAKEAVEPLLALLEEGRLTFDVCEALERITGRSGGTSAAQWRRLLDSPAPVGQPGQAAGTADAVQQAAELVGAELSGSGNRYRFTLPLPEGRQQRVSLFLGKEDSEGDELVVIYSKCGPASERHYEAVLRKNLRIPSGAFAIRDIDGEPHFVMVDTLL
jgi:hypothetical protein